MTGRHAAPRTTVVVPTMGRGSLRVLVRALAEQVQPLTAPVVLVDDRPGQVEPLALDPADRGDLDLRVVRSGGGGPARARNIGWRHARTPWVSFLDDDVVPRPDWSRLLEHDLDRLEEVPDRTGSQGRITVPLPRDRRPTDWERGTAGLETARWITADMTYRRSALSTVGGFDERFPRAFREDADLALRLGGERGLVVPGERRTQHPVRPADDLASLRQQAGNADDFLMRALHGPDWHRRAGAPVGRRSQHVAITAAGALAVGATLAGRRRAAAAAAGLWALGTAELAWARIAPGPRDRDEVRRMLVTSAAIPIAATYHSVRGWRAHRDARPWHGLPDLVLLDRDGTLVFDVPYNGDPAKVRVKPGVAQALDRLRALGIRTGIITNQSGVASGLITEDDVRAVNDRVAELVGPFDTVQVCVHGRDDGCGCRKPAPGMVKQACSDLGVDPARTVVIGDIGADVDAAAAAGASGILVPTALTRRDEVYAAAHRCSSLTRAVEDVLGGRW